MARIIENSKENGRYGEEQMDSREEKIKEIGASYIVYEQDNNYASSPLESTAVSYKNLAAIHERNK